MTRSKKQTYAQYALVLISFIILTVAIYGMNQGWFINEQTTALTGNGTSINQEDFRYDFISSGVSLGDEGDIFIADHRTQAGVHTYQTETHTYALISTGEADKDKALAFIDAELHPDQTVNLTYSLVATEDKTAISTMLVRFNSGAITDVDATFVPADALDAFLEANQ